MKVLYGKAVAKVNRHAGVILVALAVFGGGLYAYQINEVESHNRCQAEFNSAVSENIKKRADIYTRSDNVKANLLRDIGALFLLPPAKDKAEEAERTAEFLNLFRQFKVSIAQVEADRDATPYPELDDHC